MIRLYEGRNDVTLTTYVLMDSPELLAGKRRPAVLICPGGGYFNCSDREAEPVALQFASMGYHAFVLRYSTYCEGNIEGIDFSKRFSPNRNSQYPTAMREIGKCMLIIREHAEDWKVDTDRIALCGFSAGAHNTAMYAVNWQNEIISGYFGETKEKFRPAAVILGYMLSDYVYMYKRVKEKKENGTDYFYNSLIAFLGTEEPEEKLLEQVSPARCVTENMPPAFLWATAEDETVPVQHSLKMAYALAEKQIPFEIHIFVKGPHGLALADQASAHTTAEVDANAAVWTEMADRWLKRRFQLPL